MNDEVWKDIPGFEGLYKASSLGRIKNVKDCIKKLGPGSRGYLIIGLSKNNKRTTTGVARVIAQTFISNPRQKPCVNHLDGNKLNNKASNLEWCTDKENIAHAQATGLWKAYGEKHYSAKLKGVEVKQILKLKGKVSLAQLARTYKVSETTISNIVHGRTWKYLAKGPGSYE
jgi:hypothetical protein